MAECIYCGDGIYGDPSQCDTCTTDGENDVYCSICIEECDLCFDTGCMGCGTINNCDICYNNLCENCMGSTYCPKCDRCYYCSDCLAEYNGMCPECYGDASD